MANYLELINNRVIQLQLFQSTYNSLSNYVLEKHNQQWETELIVVLDSIAKCYLQNKDYQIAKETYHQTLDQIQQLQEIELRTKQAFIASNYHQLGYVAQELRQYQQAQDYYQQALEIKIEYGDRFSQADTLHNLGVVAEESRQYQQAQKYYQQALDIWIEYGDKYSQARTYGQLGMLSEELTEFAQAKSYYLQALGIFAEFEDQQSLNLIITKLASLYQKTEDNNLITEVAALFKLTEGEIRELFDRLL